VTFLWGQTYSDPSYMQWRI